MSGTTSICFRPRWHTPAAIHALSGLEWFYGEIKRIPNDAKVRVRLHSEDGKPYSVYVNLVDDLLSNSDFQLADSGINPNFYCPRCKNKHYDEATFHPFTGKTVLLEIDGQRVCSKCWHSAEKTIKPTTIETIPQE